MKIERQGDTIWLVRDDEQRELLGSAWGIAGVGHVHVDGLPYTTADDGETLVRVTAYPDGY